MSRGNQRDLARKKNQKKQVEMSKGKKSDDGLSHKARLERDAEIMRQKQMAKAAKKAGVEVSVKN